MYIDICIHIHMYDDDCFYHYKKYISPAVRNMDKQLKQRTSSLPNVKQLNKDFNVAFMGILFHAINGLDQVLPYSFLHSFQIIHDVPASGVYRATDHDLSLEEFCEVYDAIMMTNEKWMQESQRRMKEKYEFAAAAARKGDSSKLDLMKEVEWQTLLEVQQDQCAPGMDEAAFRANFTDKDGFLWAWPMPRHGVYHLIDKIRALDDARISRTNKATRLHENLVTPNFEFPARVAAEFARLCDEIRTTAPHMSSSEMPELRLGLDGLWAAYRQVPSP